MDENVIDVISVNDFKLNVNLALVSSNGRIKRTKISDFEVQRSSKSVMAFNLDEGTKLVAVRPTNGFKQLIIVASNSRAVKYSETQIPLYGTRSNGVRGIVLVDGAEVTSLVVADNTDTIGLISKRGGAKRIKVASIPASARTTQGKSIYRELKGNPHLVIDGMPVTSDTRMQFNDLSDKLQVVEFKNVPITSVDEGFSTVSSKTTVDGRILKFERISADSELLKNVEELKVSEKDKFQAAEDLIDQASQISIDDILKKL